MKTIIEQIRKEVEERRSLAKEIFEQSIEGDVATADEEQEFEKTRYSEAYADGLDRAAHLLIECDREEQLLRSMRAIAQMWQYNASLNTVISGKRYARSCLDILLEETKIEEEEIIGVNVWAVVLDETSDWDIPEEYQEYISGIESVYIYDKNRVVYACELTGSRELYHVETRPKFKKEYSESDPKFEEIDDWVKSADSERVVYVHCGRADKIERRAFVPVDTYNVCEDREEQWESILEFVCSNEVI